MTQIDTSGFQLYPHILGEDDEETRLLLPMADEALRYIRSFKWAPPIKKLSLAFGIGTIIALFLVEYERPVERTDQQKLWVVVGDMPPAYFVTNEAPNAAEALAAYCELMDDWADRVLSGGDLAESYPVAVAPTTEHAQMLKSRIETIRNEFIPMARVRLKG